MHFPAFIFVEVFFSCFLLCLFILCFFLQDQLGKGRQPGCCLCKLESAVVKEMFDRVYLVVDCSVLFMHVQFLSSFDHSVMHWLNFGLNQKFWITTTVSNYKCMQTLPSAASLALMILRMRNCLNFDFERA